MTDIALPTPDVVALPSRIGGYRVLGRIGRGGMGSVVRAHHVEMEALVAIKTVHSASARTVISIRREIRSLARIRHPGIVRIHDEGVEGGFPWYAMELVEGVTRSDFRPRSPGAEQDRERGEIDHNGSTGPDNRRVSASPTLYPFDTACLKSPQFASEAVLGATRAACHNGAVPAGRTADTLDAPPFPGDHDVPEGWQGGMPPLAHLERGELPPAAGGDLHRVLRLIRRLCAPLAYLHGEGLVHCDLKPANVLVRPGGQPVLVDFGVTAHFAGRMGREALDVRRAFTGTAAYMSPEQLRGELLDARADLYSPGCILYELVTGRVPFLGATAHEPARAHTSAALRSCPRSGSAASRPRSTS